MIIELASTKLSDHIKEDRSETEKGVRSMKELYIGRLRDRFGYDLRVVTDSEEKARRLLMKEYRRAYKDLWGVFPSKEETDTAKDELDISPIELDKVEWE